jgi:hypothetical protein
LLYKNEARGVWWCGVFDFWNFFKIELHANFVHDWNFLYYDSLMELKVNAFNSLEDKQLICFLFFHDQVFAANYRQEIFTWGNLHADYLVWLSGFCFKQLDGNL